MFPCWQTISGHLHDFGIKNVVYINSVVIVGGTHEQNSSVASIKPEMRVVFILTCQQNLIISKLNYLHSIPSQDLTNGSRRGWSALDGEQGVPVFLDVGESRRSECLVCVCDLTESDGDSQDGSWGEKALNVPGTEWDQDRGGRGFSREAGEEEGYSFRGERLERWGLEVSRVWYSWLWGSVSRSYSPSETSDCLIHFYINGSIHCMHFWVEDVYF